MIEYMAQNSSRRDFLGAGLALPAVGLAGAAAQTPGAATGVKYTTLGKTGLKVSTLGFGCMLTSDASVIERAVDMGINLFDTARVYNRGNNERMVGTALGARRKSVFVASKTLNTQTKQAALDDLDTSLKTLGTDYLDIWYLHDKRTAAGITDELIDAQQTAKKAGKIRFAGVSFHTGHKDLVPAVLQRGKFEVVLLTYNFAMDPALDPLIKAVHDAGIGVVAMKVMAGSFRLEGIDYDRARAAVKRPGGALAALKWVFKNPNVDCAIPSMTSADQLVENARAMSSGFGENDAKVLAYRLDGIRPLYCRACGACSGTCPNGLPVADMLRYLMYADGYGQFPLGRENFLGLSEEVRAVRCNDCSTCAVRCPNGVKVAERLIRAQELFA
jgi:uncharacterized protein